MIKKRRHPKFQRQNYGSIKRVGRAWRKPHGIDSKQRLQWKSAGALPTVGYRNAKSVRYLHPSGFREVRVRNEKELRAVEKNTAARFSAAIGEKKRKVLRKIASELKVKLLN